jgi:hypothetical protein
MNRDRVTINWRFTRKQARLNDELPEQRSPVLYLLKGD